MALKHFTKLYGIEFAGCLAVLREARTGGPARVYLSPTGHRASENGQLALSAAGSVDFYADDSLTYSLYIYSGRRETGLILALCDHGLEAGDSTPAIIQATPSGAPALVSAEPAPVPQQEPPVLMERLPFVLRSTDLEGRLDSDSVTAALRADQGQVLKQLIDRKFEMPVGGLSASHMSIPVKTCLTRAATAVQSRSLRTVGGESLVGVGNISLDHSEHGTVGELPVVIDLARLRVVGAPHVLSVVPASGCKLRIEQSCDAGVTFSGVGYVSKPSVYRYVLHPGEVPANRVRISRAVGSVTTSTYSIG